MTEKKDMDAKAAELLSALPEDFQESDVSRAELAALVEELSHRPVPTGRLTRLWSLGSLQARMGVAYTLLWLRERFAAEDRRAELRREHALKTALKVFGCMSYLRGAAMKAGQILASYPDVVPDELVQRLGDLHFQAPPMHFSLLREFVRRELGAPVEERFASFDPEAFAAASLGQVHRARLHGGEEVAVKIQYPGIDATVRADLKNLKALLTPLRLRGDWQNLMAQLDELQHGLVLETDYAREADEAERLAAALEGMEDVVVPRVHRDHSSARVLTLDLLEGLHPSEWVRSNPHQDRRDRHGTQILRTSMRLYYSERTILADPNPGNFLLLPDGRLGLLDFGCFRRFTDEEWAAVCTGLRCFRDPTPAHFAEMLRRCGLFTEEELQDQALVDSLRPTVDWMWEPLRAAGDFDFAGNDYLQRGIRIFGELVKAGRTRQLPVLTWQNRGFYGIRGLLHLLRARVPAGRLHEEELARAGLEV